MKSLNRRKFIKNSAFATGAALTFLPDAVASTSLDESQSPKADRAAKGEVLYNGIVLPAQWPPRGMKPDSWDPMLVQCLQPPPQVIPIDVGRQLFVDDFLIEKTDLTREFHQPVKHPGNPVLRPETKEEMGEGNCPMAAPFSDGCFYDPEAKVFSLWYQAGWYDDKTAQAISTDGIHWKRPKLDVVPGTNLVINTKGLNRDSVSG